MTAPKLKPCPLWLLVVTSGAFISLMNNWANSAQHRIDPFLTALIMFVGAVGVAAITGSVYWFIAAWNRRVAEGEHRPGRAGKGRKK